MSDGKREMRLAMAKRYEEGDLTKAQFCKLEGVSLGNLDYWRRQLRDEAHGGFLEADFVELRPAVRPEGKSPQIEIELPFGVTLRIFGGGA